MGRARAPARAAHSRGSDATILATLPPENSLTDTRDTALLLIGWKAALRAPLRDFLADFSPVALGHTQATLDRVNPDGISYENKVIVADSQIIHAGY